MMKLIGYLVLGVGLGVGLFAPAHGQRAARVSRQRPNSTAVRINELMPDPLGADTWGKEYVELVNTSLSPRSVAGWTLQDAAGIVLHTINDITLPGRDEDGASYLVVVFGPEVPSASDDSFDDGDQRRVLFTGSSNLLANDVGALILANAHGLVVDAVLYGTSEPSGAGVDAVRSHGHWSGPRVDTLFSAGAIPILEGGVLGRDLDSDDYHNASDWRADGGKNAFGPTFGRRNNAAAFDGINDMLDWCQTELNNVISIFSLYNEGYIDVLDATHTDDVISDPDQSGGFSVASTHVFTLDDARTGVAEVMAGTLSVGYERIVGSSFELSIQGTLSGTTHALQIDILHVYSGFGTQTHQVVGSYDCTWTKRGTPYTYVNETTQVESWNGARSRDMLDHRDWTDWSGNAKHSDSRSRVQLVADGRRQVSFELVRSFPYAAPPFGQAQAMYTGVAVSALAYTEAVDGLGLTSKSFARFDQSFGYGFNAVDPFSSTSNELQMRLQPGTLGTLVEARTAGDPWDEIGAFSTVGSYPIEYVDPAGLVTSACTFTTKLVHTVGDVSSSDGVQKRLTRGNFRAQCDATVLADFDYAIDPVDVCDCGCGGEDCNCGGGRRKRTGLRKWGLIVAKGISYGSCAMGAVGSAGLGTFAAGAMSYGAGELIEEMVPHD